MLYLVGAGLAEGDLSLKALEILKEVDEIYAEEYTSFMPPLPREISDKVKFIPREKVESDFLINLAENKDIALLVPGDPLFATTHISLIKECIDRGIDWKVVHAPSIINAMLIVGLSPYKFGRIITLAGKYESDKEKYEKNLTTGLHTLVLVDPKMSLKEALEVLAYFGVDKAVLCQKLGTEEQKIWYGSLDELSDVSTKKPFCFIIPAKDLHFFEEEMLEMWKNNLKG